MEPTALKLVAYYRMSSDDQTTSIAQQRNEVRAHAQKMGWEIVREEEDPGKSGLLPWEKRPGFVRMLNDCERLKDVNAVLVWHSNRFGRGDALDSAEPKRRLRELGMWLESVKEGRIDWNTSMGRIMDVLASEQNNKYVHDLSAAVVRGMNDRASQGWRSKGVAPFGYDREYHSPDGARTMHIKRTERFKAPMRWGMKLVINEDEAAIVRWIFERFTSGDSLTGIARAMNQRGVQVPYAHRPTRRMKKGTWGVSTVSDILQNRVYVGTYVVGKDHARKSLNRMNHQVRHDTFPSIIDTTQFDAAQTLIDSKRLRKVRPRTGGGPLQGVVHCGCCGLPLYRHKATSGVTNKRTLYYYACCHRSENPALGCRNWRVREDKLMPIVLWYVTKAIDWEVLEQIKLKQPKAAKGQLDALRRRRDELKRDVERGTENLLLANARTFPLLQKKLDELQGEVDALENTLKLAEMSDAGLERQDRIDWLKNIQGRIVTLAGPNWKYDPHEYLDNYPFPMMTEVGALRSLLLSLGIKVTVTWTPNGNYHYKLHRVVIEGGSNGDGNGHGAVLNLIPGGGAGGIATSGTSVSSIRGPFRSASCSRRSCSSRSWAGW